MKEKQKQKLDLNLQTLKNELLSRCRELMDKVLEEACLNRGDDLYKALRFSIPNYGTSMEIQEQTIKDHNSLIKDLGNADIYQSVDILIKFLSKYKVIINNSNKVWFKLITPSDVLANNEQSEALSNLAKLKICLQCSIVSDDQSEAVNDLILFINESNSLDEVLKEYEKADTLENNSFISRDISMMVFGYGLAIRILTHLELIDSSYVNLVNYALTLSFISFTISWAVYESAIATKYSLIRNRRKQD